ncbi:MAG: sensor protein Chase2, partial [Leptolyngbyaceae cyanobacterium bins.59]|nr:sensor protein Chase2 [Leptolyngbyaceae cyanobacterium bins.59]
MLVTIECEGSVEQGFSVRLRIGEEGRSPSTEVSGRLPPAPDLNGLYLIWQSAYRQLGDSFRIDAADNQVTNVSFRDRCTQTAQDLVDRFNQWLGGASLRTLREQLVSEVAKKEPLRIILKTKDGLLRRLPWHTWDVLEKH